MTETNKLGLTPRQAEAFDIIKRWIKNHGSPPTQRELGEELGITQQAASKLFDQLESRGWITRAPKLPNSLIII